MIRLNYAVIFGLILSTVCAQAGQEDGAVTAQKSPPPPPIQVAGSWVGAIDDSNKGAGNISVVLTEKESKTKGALKGTWTINFPNNAPGGTVNDVGKVTGSVVGSEVTMTLAPRPGAALGTCKLVFKSPDASESAISGTYQFTSCGGLNTGTIDLQPGTPADTVYINVGDDFFYPTKVTVNAGQTVVWTNNGNELHTVTNNPGSDKCKPSSGEAFDSATISKGQTYEHTFNTSGSFPYHCEIHGCPMKGNITVN